MSTVPPPPPLPHEHEPHAHLPHGQRPHDPPLLTYAATQPQQYTSVPPMNALAIIALVASFTVGIAGVICGHLALSQIKRTGERGHALALTGTIVGYCSVALGALATAGVIVILVLGGQFGRGPLDGSVAHDDERLAGSTDCETVIAAGTPISETLTDTLNALKASRLDADAARDASVAIDSAIREFEGETFDISDQDLRDQVESVVDELTTLSTDLDSFARGEDESTRWIERDLADVASAIRGVSAYCG